ncbi:MAG: monovalent cation/H(+) antiporter subunit G [Phycisphaeraceae bacterium]
MIARDLFTVAFLAIGLFFMFVGAVGVVRLPDPYNRLHGATKCSTLGLLGLLIATVVHIGDLSLATKAVLTMLFIFASNPVGSHMLAKAALRDGVKKWHGTIDDESEATHVP